MTSPALNSQSPTTSGSSELFVPASASPSPTDNHLSYPAPSTSEVPSSLAAQPRPLLRERLYVGNLHHSVDEYTLLQVFTKFGKVSKLDYLFHKTGPMKGKPRGYAFVEYSDPNDADKALAIANDKLLRGRKLVITHAHQAPLDYAGPHGSRFRRGVSEAGKPTTLSLLKSAATGRSDATGAKIAKMEAKLRQMEQSASSSSTASTASIHPSLPSKPVQSALAPSAHSSTSSTFHRQSSGRMSSQRKNQLPLPSLPLTNPARPSASTLALAQLPVTSPRTEPSKKASLAGVLIMKKKDK
ncbi:hypothetical protein AcV5_003314 [Taiwanofungus camphoratus]|nr:hypothetical protein AcV5_003314 [Antrodia cinnamomea]